MRLFFHRSSTLPVNNSVKIRINLSFLTYYSRQFARATFAEGKYLKQIAIFSHRIHRYRRPLVDSTWTMDKV